MFCTKCGSQIGENVRFCTKCGNKIQNTNEGNKASVASQNMVQPNGVSPKAVQPGGAQPNVHPHVVQPNGVPPKAVQPHVVQPKVAEAPKKENKYGIRIALLAFIVILLLALALVVWVLPEDFFSSEKLESFIHSGKYVDEDEEDEDEEDDEEETTEEVPEISVEEHLTLIDEKIAAAEYAEAFQLMEEIKAYDSTNETVYLYESDAYLKQNDYLSAVNALDSGIEQTASEALKNRRNYIVNNVVVKTMSQEGGGYSYTNTYDNRGNLTREELYDANYKPTGWSDYTFDDGLLRVVITYDANGKFAKQTNYSYDAERKLTYVEEYNSKKKKQGSHKYNYDNFGRITEVIDCDKNDRTLWKTTSEYDSFGRLFRNAGYTKGGRKDSWVETIYNADGSVSKMIRYDKNKKVVEWNETIYDTDGKPVESINYKKEDILVDSIKYFYDANGKKTREVYYDANGAETGYAEFNSAGKKIREQNKNTKEVWAFEYQYIGDVLCDTELTPLSGTLSFSQSVAYKRVPVFGAEYVNTVLANSMYTVVGETKDFYKVDKGWYFYKTDEGIIFNSQQSN